MAQIWQLVSVKDSTHVKFARWANEHPAAILGIQGRDQSGFIPPERARVEAIVSPLFDN